jgi:hypothetical protein
MLDADGGSNFYMPRIESRLLCVDDVEARALTCSERRAGVSRRDRCEVEAWVRITPMACRHPG